MRGEGDELWRFERVRSNIVDHRCIPASCRNLAFLSSLRRLTRIRIACDDRIVSFRFRRARPFFQRHITEPKQRTCGEREGTKDKEVRRTQD